MYIQQDKPLLIGVMDEISNFEMPIGNCHCPHCANPIRFPIIAKQSDVELFETVMRSAYEVMDRYGITVNLLAEIKAQCVVALANQKVAHGIKEKNT